MASVKFLIDSYRKAIGQMEIRPDRQNKTIFSKQRSCRYYYMDALHGRKRNLWRNSLTVDMQGCCELYWTSPGGSTLKKHQPYGCPAPILKTILIRRTRHAENCRRSKDELIGDVLLWTPSYGRAKVGRPAKTFTQQLCADTGSRGPPGSNGQ